MFDRVVHQRNSKTGKITVSPYRQVCENGQIFLVRDGIKYHEDGSLVEKPQVDIVEVNLGLPASEVLEEPEVASKKRK